jgi:hypothetical protein
MEMKEQTMDAVRKVFGEIDPAFYPPPDRNSTQENFSNNLMLR